MGACSIGCSTVNPSRSWSRSAPSSLPYCSISSSRRASFASMATRQNQLATAVGKDPNVVSLTSFIGVDGTNTTLNSGRFLINLKPKDDRSDDIATIVRRLASTSRNIPGMSIYLQPVQDLTIDSTISRAEYQFILEAPNTAALDQWVPNLMSALQREPDLENVSTNY